MSSDAFEEGHHDNSGMQRVKLYRLTSEGLWEEKGTGSVSVEYMEVCVLTQPAHISDCYINIHLLVRGSQAVAHLA